MENNAFLGKEGLTSSSANHIANLAKEYADAMMSSINSIHLMTETVSTSGMQDVVVVKATEDISFMGIMDSVNRMMDANSLIAWLREGIKAKEEAGKLVNDVEYIIEKYGIAAMETQKPCMPSMVTVDEIISDTWSVGKRNKYLSLQARTACLGKLIHPNGALANKKDEFIKRQSEPVVITGDGANMTIRKFESARSLDYVCDIFTDLQKSYRELQAEFNGMKHEAEVAANLLYETMLDGYKKGLAAYNAELDRYNLALEEAKMKERAYVDSLKIIIPRSLEEIYKIVQGENK